MTESKKILKYPNVPEELQERFDRAYKIQSENLQSLYKTMFTLSGIFVSVVIGFLKDIKALSYDAKIAIFIGLSAY